VIASPPSAGPIKDGCVCFSKLHAASITAVAAIATRRPRVPNVLCMSLT
jgi:hypothetical protein